MRALHVNAPRSPHLGVGARKAEEGGPRGRHTLQTQSSGLEAISLTCPEVKLKEHGICSRVTWVEFPSPGIFKLSQKRISRFPGPRLLYLSNENKICD